MTLAGDLVIRRGFTTALRRTVWPVRRLVEEAPPQESAATVLISVYGSDPQRGSEPGVGFHWLHLYLTLGFRVIAIVHGDRKGGIARTSAAFAKEIADGRLLLEVVGIPPLLRLLNRTPGCYYLYYQLYQRRVLARARRHLARDRSIAFAHHVTMNGFREPGYLWRLPVPFVWGPIGGVQNSPPEFLKEQSPFARSREKIRSTLNHIALRRSVRPRRARKQASIIFAANSDSYAWASAQSGPRVTELLETAVPVSASADQPRRLSTRILWIGNDEPRKNPEFALLAFALVARQFPEATLTMVGLGERRRRGLSRFAKRRRCPLDRVHMRGAVARHELESLYQSAGLFWFTSYRDTSGNVLLEAMRAGLPALAFNHQGAAGILRDCGENLVELGSYPAMLRDWAGKSRSLLRSEEQWLHNAFLMRQRVQERYTWRHTACVVARELQMLRLAEVRR